MKNLESAREIWVVDFEYRQPSNHLPSPHCVVARELRSGKLIKLWLGDDPPAAPPFDVEKSIYVAYNAVAEALCHRVLGWPAPLNVLDLYAEFRNFVADRRQQLGVERLSLLDALKFFKLNCISASEKTMWRGLAIRGGPYTAEEKLGLLEYCREDVDGTVALFEKMRSHLDVPRALLRGRFAVCASKVQQHGIPLDEANLQHIQDHRECLRAGLIEDVDESYHVFENGKFSSCRFQRWAKSQRIPWPHHPSGKPVLDRDTFSDMAKLHPSVQPLHELRKTLSELNNQNLAVAPDGRSHVSPGVFGTLTGRNSPRASEFIFARAKWWRYLIQPSPAHVLLYFDWRSQEFAIAAALSRDEAMMAAYRSGDAYLGFGMACGAIPQGATKATHTKERQIYKVATLALQFGIGAEKLGLDLGGGPVAGVRMLERYRETFPDFTRWSEGQADKAALGGILQTPFGWRLVADASNVKPRTFKNFPVQATGGDMMRIAVILMIQSGVKICAMVHDGFLIEAPVQDVEHVAWLADSCMREASRLALYGFEVDVDRDTFADRFRDPAGADMWRKICLLTGIEDAGGGQFDHPPPAV
ncbi:MAG: DNA polymerase-1 [Verrucomicrobiales bacterium]|jgi:DNA polymerase-1